MRRRDFLALIGSASVAARTPARALAQASARNAAEQVDRNLRWFLLDSRHPDFAVTRAALLREWRAHSLEPPEEVSGRNLGERIVKTYLTSQQKATFAPSLRIGAAAVLDEFNYAASYNPNYAPRRMNTNQWGDTFAVWGAFLEAPMRLPTAGEDRRLAHAMGRGRDSVIYIGQENVGSGDGSSYMNRRQIREFLAHEPGRAIAALRDYDVVVLCGTLSRFVNEGSQAGLIAGHGFYVKSGTPAERTQILSHPVDTARLMGGPKLGSGAWGEPRDWVPEGGGMWSIDCGMSRIGTNHFVLSDAGGTLRPLAKVDYAAVCAVTPDSFFPEPNYRGTRDRIFVNLAEGSNPRNTTYVPTNAGGVMLLTAHTSHFDIYGVEIYQAHWLGSFHAYNSDWGAYACKWLYGGPGKCVSAYAALANEGTGQFTHGPFHHVENDAPRNRVIAGCAFEYHGDGVYDSAGHDLVPFNTVIRDCYFYKIGEKASRAFGVELANNDSHCIGNQGHRGLTIRNCRLDQCGRAPIVLYPFNQHFADPTETLTDGIIANGRFDSGLDGWTTSGKVTHSEGAARVNTGTLEQAVSIGGKYSAKNHVLKFKLQPHGSIVVSIAGAPGQPDIQKPMTVTANASGIAAIHFVPRATAFVVRFAKTGTVMLDDVELLKSLKNEPVFVAGYPPAYSYRLADGNWLYHQPYTDVLIAHNWFTNPIIDHPVIQAGQAISLQGDSGHYGHNGQIRNVKILHNRIEGEFTDGSIRLKWKLPAPFDVKQIEIAHNVIRGASLALFAFDAATDENGHRVGPSFWFHHNDVHVRADSATRKPGLFVALGGVAGPHQRMVLEDNVYRFEENELLTKPLWRRTGKPDTASLFIWQGSAPPGDRHDLNSKMQPLSARERK